MPVSSGLISRNEEISSIPPESFFDRLTSSWTKIAAASFSSIAMLILFAVSIAIKKPSFRDYDVCSLVVMLINFLLLVTYIVAEIIQKLRKEWTRKCLLVYSIFVSIIICVLSVVGLVRFHARVFPNCIFGFALFGGFNIVLLNGIFYLYYQKEKDQSTYAYPLVEFDLNIDGRKETAKFKAPIADPSPEIENKIRTEESHVNPSSEQEHHNGFHIEVEEARDKKKEEDKGSEENLMESDNEIEESIVRELPPMYDPEIIEHMDIRKRKVIWKKTHFILGLESGGKV